MSASLPLDDRPEPMDTVRFLDGADMAALISF
jgi:hypothetical protein